MTKTAQGLPPKPQDEPADTTSAPAWPTLAKVAALMEAAIAPAPAKGIAVPPDLARGTFAGPHKLTAPARTEAAATLSPMRYHNAPTMACLAVANDVPQAALSSNTRVS